MSRGRLPLPDPDNAGAREIAPRVVVCAARRELGAIGPIHRSRSFAQPAGQLQLTQPRGSTASTVRGGNLNPPASPAGPGTIVSFASIEPAVGRTRVSSLLNDEHEQHRHAGMQHRPANRHCTRVESLRPASAIRSTSMVLATSTTCAAAEPLRTPKRAPAETTCRERNSSASARPACRLVPEPRHYCAAAYVQHDQLSTPGWANRSAAGAAALVASGGPSSGDRTRSITARRSCTCGGNSLAGFAACAMTCQHIARADRYAASQPTTALGSFSAAGAAAARRCGSGPPRRGAACAHPPQ